MACLFFFFALERFEEIRDEKRFSVGLEQSQLNSQVQINTFGPKHKEIKRPPC